MYTYLKSLAFQFQKLLTDSTETFLLSISRWHRLEFTMCKSTSIHHNSQISPLNFVRGQATFYLLSRCSPRFGHRSISACQWLDVPTYVHSREFTRFSWIGTIQEETPNRKQETSTVTFDTIYFVDENWMTVARWSKQHALHMTRFSTRSLPSIVPIFF